jgi:hypothetical protein
MWKNDASWKYFGSTDVVNQRYQSPLQGSHWCNCTFLAALSSMTWVNPNVIQDQGTGPYQFSFYDGGAWVVVKVNSDLLVSDLTASPPSFCGAKSALFSLANGEIWPAIYEKAYAKFCLYKKNLITQASLTDPKTSCWGSNNPCTLTDVDWGGNPVTVLARLAGCTSYPQPMYTYDSDGCPDLTKPNFPDIYTYLRTNFCSASGGLYKTQYPMAAWTFSDEACVNGKRYIPNSCHYSLNGIQKNHSYSILGVFAANSVNYLVLRDPCGIDPSDPAITPKLCPASTVWQYGNKFFVICPATGTMSSGIGNPATIKVPFPTGKGIFALRASEFGNYFEGFGWIR